MSKQKLTRSDEPIWWALFSAGGVCFAVIIPGCILLLAILAPLGILSADALSYQHIYDLLFSDLYGLGGLAFIGATICLPLYHAMHRIHHGLHDIKLAHGVAAKIICYGIATLLSLLALFWWLLTQT